MANSVDLDEVAHLSHLIKIYAVCKFMLFSSLVVKELTTVNLLYNGTHYNSKILYNVILICTKCFLF